MSMLALANRLLRFKTDANSWAERGISEQTVLADLRLHPGFQAFGDALDAELANTFFLWLQTEPTETTKLADLHARGRVLRRVTVLLDDTTQAKSRAEALEAQIQEAERIMSAQKTHQDRRRSAAQAARGVAEANAG